MSRVQLGSASLLAQHYTTVLCKKLLILGFVADSRNLFPSVLPII